MSPLHLFGFLKMYLRENSFFTNVGTCLRSLIPCLFLLCPFTGEYLALTGEKLNGVEMIACGLATHYSLNAVSARFLSL